MAENTMWGNDVTGETLAINDKGPREGYVVIQLRKPGLDMDHPGPEGMDVLFRTRSAAHLRQWFEQYRFNAKRGAFYKLKRFYAEAPSTVIEMPVEKQANPLPYTETSGQQ